MNDEESVPTQMSLDVGLAPDVRLAPLPRQAGKLYHMDGNWKLVKTAASGLGWHLIRRSRGGNQVVTVCGLGGRKVSGTAELFEPCGDCLAKISE